MLLAEGRYFKRVLIQPFYSASDLESRLVTRSPNVIYKNGTSEFTLHDIDVDLSQPCQCINVTGYTILVRRCWVERRGSMTGGTVQTVE